MFVIEPQNVIRRGDILLALSGRGLEAESWGEGV